MKITLLNEGIDKWLRLPYEYGAEEVMVTITDMIGEKVEIPIKLSKSRIDLWMSYPLNEITKGTICVEGPENSWIKAACIGMEPASQKRRELSRPKIHYMPPTGGIRRLQGLCQFHGEWFLSYQAVPCSLSNQGGIVGQTIQSKDLLHWEASVEKKHVEQEMIDAKCWIGDVEEQYIAKDDEIVYALAKSTCGKIESLAAACILSLPGMIDGGIVSPAPAMSNLRIWERVWHNEPIRGEFHFLMRFKQGPDVWPEIKLLEPEHTIDDIKTDACEIEIELFIGQENFVEFDYCGVLWKWDALEQKLACGNYSVRVPVVDGRLHLHFYRDMVVQEVFTGTDKAFLVIQEDGPKKDDYKIQSELVENINNASFYLQYNADPYITIRTSGNSASLISLKVWGLRPITYQEDNRRLIKNTEKGKKLYSCEAYTVYENCVEDRIYGDPAAWAVNGGKTVLSPIRTVEEFRWRDTPWGDMTRIAERSERWDKPSASVYPGLETKYNVLNAAFALSTEIMEQNRDERYALPGQEGLMNAALFQREGEGFGSWVRDTCHAAFRCQNLLAPEEARESLIYVSEHGFNNGEDCAAMPAIAAWDYYEATGDIQLLYEMLPGILRYAEEADSRYDKEKNLVHASMCLAQDAFEEPENGGYCLGTEIAFALMYQAVSEICKVTENENVRTIFWRERSEKMIQSIREKFWNEEKGCFTSGLIGSEAYEKGWWELTGAEMALWPRFHVASEVQRKRFIETIKNTPDACSEFGINWYPFRKEKNHFWRACWVSWTLGIAAAAGDLGDEAFIRKLIFGQVRNVLLHKSFHEVMDYDTGRAWRWPHLPWHAAGFIGYIVNGVFGIRYDGNGITMRPAVPPEFDGAILCGVPYRESRLTFEIHGSGNNCRFELDGQPLETLIDGKLKGLHKIDIFASR